MYHHPYVSYLKSEKIIISIANIQFRFGHISLMQYVQSALTNDFLSPLSLSSLNIIFFTFFLIYCGEILFKKLMLFTINIDRYEDSPVGDYIGLSMDEFERGVAV